jgi:RHS repeat-associated protein
MQNPSPTGSTEIGWECSYDPQGRIATVREPGLSDSNYRYETYRNKRIQRITRQFPDGNAIIHEFDQLGRRVLVSLNGKSDEGPSSVHYGYDELGRLTTARWGNGARIEFGYDTRGRVVSTSVDDHFIVRTVHDFLGRVEKLVTPVGDITYEFQTGQGKIVRRLPNGVWTVWETGVDGSIDSITHVDPSNHILMKLEYGYRPDGLIREIREWTPTGEKVIAYDYDRVQRLVSVADSGGDHTEYGYDSFGNRTGIRVNGGELDAGCHDWLGRLMRLNGGNCAHDAAENLTFFPAKDGDRHFEFNARGLLKTAVTPKGKVAYRYDGDARLIGRTFAGKDTRFVPDPLETVWKPLMAMEESGEKTFYIYEGDVPLAVVQGGTPRFLLHDHLGSVRLMVDGEGTPLPSFSYDAFGIPLTPQTNHMLAPGFGGLFYDSISETLVTQARAYLPRLGRFLQMDPHHRVPMGSQEDLSPYSYCGCDPVNRIDREGRSSSWAWGLQNLTSQFTIGALSTLDAFKTHCSQQSEAAIASAQTNALSLLWATTQATFWDAVGGLMPGEAANQGQAYAQVMWSLVPGMQTVSAWRTYASLAVSTAQGDAYDVFSSVLSIGGGAFASKAQKLLSGTRVLPSGQFEFVFRNAKTIRHASYMQTAANWVDVYGHYENVVSVWKIGMKDWSSPSPSPISPPSTHLPTNVGGIYLRGAGKSLEGMGNLRGIALDENNGRLILLSEDLGRVALPPLRLDDVVTIFRSVYEKGEAPFVSIDPNPDDPNGPIMLTRHGEMTRESYVGWTMFEADRVMKAYSLGKDNLTRQPVQTTIAGYQSLLDSGFSDERASKGDKVWERFWIVPASVTRRESMKAQLTLFDVPLRVMTQRMILENGKLVPAPDDTPSPQAKAFAEWFTRNYDRLSDEVLGLPPEETGIKAPVSFFHELRRVALVTAIAERLCEQGVSMPQWMKSYTVDPCPLVQTTPAITVEKTGMETVQKKKWWGGSSSEQRQVTRRIYGGVNLAPDDSNVHTVAGDAEAENIHSQVQQAVAASPLFSPVDVKVNGKICHAAALPGNDTKALGASILNETDLIVPIHDDGALRLERTCHSFFRPSGELGIGWTLDLPRLEKQKRPIRRKGDLVEFTTIFAMQSPLNTLSARFDRRRFVPEVKGELLVADSSPEILGLARGSDDRIGFETEEVIFRDGQQWHFDKSGNLAARIQGPIAVIYRRGSDVSQEITRFEGWYGHERRSDIRITYDEKGRLKKASGSDDQEVAYFYNSDGELSRVTKRTGELTYAYHNGCLIKISRDGDVVRTFTYNDQGQVLKEWRKEAGEVRHRIQADEKGYRLSTFPGDSNQPQAEVEYDLSFRPIKKLGQDGTQVHWNRSCGKEDEITVTTPEGDEVLITESEAGRRRTLTFPGGAILAASLDEAGQITSMQIGGKTLLKQTWHHNGQPGTIEDASTAFRHEYRHDGTMRRILVTPPGDAERYDRWASHETDEQGRTTRISDFTGLDEKVTFDESGNISSWKNHRGSATVERNLRKKTESIETSWGIRQETEFDTANQVVRTDITREGATASIEFDRGAPVRIRQFDGGETRISYAKPDLKSHIAQPDRIITPNQTELKYAYTPEGRISTVTCENGFRVEYAYDFEGRIIGLKKSRQ